MGDCGHYNAGVQARFKRDLTISVENTDEQIAEFLKSKGGTFTKEEECESEDIDISLIEDGSILGFVVELNGETWDSRTDDDFFEILDGDEKNCKAILQCSIEELKFLDLKILSEYKSIPLDADVYKDLASVYESIYCNNDNSCSTVIDLPKDVLQALIDGTCVLTLYGDGGGNC
ncbi:MAG: hypothetical protein ACYDD5_00390 [Sulfuricurvum sp.]